MFDPKDSVATLRFVARMLRLNAAVLLIVVLALAAICALSIEPLLNFEYQTSRQAAAALHTAASPRQPQ
jgi:hypothetical protein